MAGVPGNIAFWAVAEQTAKGAYPATGADFKTVNPFTGGNASPTRETDQLSETDSSRVQGDTYVQQTAASGAPEAYVRGVNIHRLLKLALGTAAAPVGPTNFTHVITPGATLPYCTFAKGQGNLLWEEYQDSKINELTISADTGGPLTVTADFLGRKSVRKTSAWASLPSLAGSVAATDHIPYNMNNATVTLDGGATSLVSSFELTIANNVTLQQTDDSVPFDVVEGVQEVTLGFQLIFDSLTAYNEFHYGSAAGTTQSDVLDTTSAIFSFAKGANNEVSFNLPRIAYEEFPVEPDAGGDPVVVDVRARTQRGATAVTATVKNQDAGT